MGNTIIETISFRELCPNIKSTKYSTHALHSYPAQLIPHIPNYFLRELHSKYSECIVFDPFCGTGTVLVEAMHKGFDSIGVEINPIAALISKVKTTAIDTCLLENGLKIINVNYKKKAYNYKKPDFYQHISYWFNETDIKNLMKLKESIGNLEEGDIKNFFLVMFSSIIKDVSKSDPRIYVPVMPNDGYQKKRAGVWENFYKKSQYGINKMKEYIDILPNNKSQSRIINKDIKRLDENIKSDIVITSPPYISAQKYVRSTRLESYWLDYTQDFQLNINKKTIGTERVLKKDYIDIHNTKLPKLNILIKKIFKKNKERAYIVSKYFNDMEEVIKKLYNFLNQEGYLIMVIGNNTVTKYEVKTSDFIKNLMELNGFVIEKIYKDEIISRGLMVKRNSTANIINYEWIIKAKKG